MPKMRTKPTVNTFTLKVEINHDPAYKNYTVSISGLEESGNKLKPLLIDLIKQFADELGIEQEEC